jgi:hypothetical protein
MQIIGQGKIYLMYNIRGQGSNCLRLARGINKLLYTYSLPSVAGAKNSYMLLIYFIIKKKQIKKKKAYITKIIILTKFCVEKFVYTS